MFHFRNNKLFIVGGLVVVIFLIALVSIFGRSIGTNVYTPPLFTFAPTPISTPSQPMPTYFYPTPPPPATPEPLPTYPISPITCSVDPLPVSIQAQIDALEHDLGVLNGTIVNKEGDIKALEIQLSNLEDFINHATDPRDARGWRYGILPITTDIKTAVEALNMLQYQRMALVSQIDTLNRQSISCTPPLVPTPDPNPQP